MLYSFIPTECGGVMTREVPGTYRGSDYCQWIIEEPGQKHLRIVLRSYLSQIVNVHIYDNSTGSEGRLLNSYNLQVSNVQNIDEYFDSNLVTVSAAGVASSLYFVYIRYEMASQGTVSSPGQQQMLALTDFICSLWYQLDSSLRNYPITELASKICL